MKKHFGLSLEETIRNVQRQNAHKSSPLAILQNNPGFVPTQIPNHMRQNTNTRDMLLNGFCPPNDLFKIQK